MGMLLKNSKKRRRTSCRSPSQDENNASGSNSSSDMARPVPNRVCRRSDAHESANRMSFELSGFGSDPRILRGAVSSPSDSDNALPISKISRAFDSFHSALQLFAEATNESEAVITKQREDLKKEKRDHEALKVEFDQYKQSMSSLFDENNMRYKQVTNAADAKIERLQRDNENLRKFKEKSTGHRLERIHELKVDELNQLAHDLNAGLEDVQKERDTRRKCVICLENLKNTYFIDGCDHIVLCSDCEGKMANKRCPVCRAPFSETKRLHISHGFLF